MPSHKLLIPSILKNITPILENLIEKIAEDTDRDHFLSPKEAVEYGLIDKVVTSLN